MSPSAMLGPPLGQGPVTHRGDKLDSPPSTGTSATEPEVSTHQHGRSSGGSGAEIQQHGCDRSDQRGRRLHRRILGQWKGYEKEIVSAVFWMILLFRERIVESFDRPVSVRRPLGPPRSPRSPFPGHSRYVYDVPVMPPERPDTPALESRACVRVRKAANQLFFARLTGRWGGKGLAPQLRLVYMCVAAGVERLG